MNKHESIEETKTYAKAFLAELFRTALVNFIEEQKDLHAKMKELGLAKQPLVTNPSTE